MSKYAIINVETLQTKLKELYEQRDTEPDNHTQSYLNGRIKQLEETISQSIPFIPQIEKAYNWGYTHCEDGCEQDVNDCTSNLKLDI